MISCRDDLDDGALALAGSRDYHWGPTSSNHLSILCFSSPLLKVLLCLSISSLNVQEAILVLPSGFPYSDFRHYWSSVSSSDYMASPYLKYGLLASATFEVFILWIKSSSFSERESSQLHPVRIRFINHFTRKSY